MSLDGRIAAVLADARLVEWQRIGYYGWRAMLDDKDIRQVVGEDGKRYSVVSYALDDGDGRIRMSVAVDDGPGPRSHRWCETRSCIRMARSSSDPPRPRIAPSVPRPERRAPRAASPAYPRPARPGVRVMDACEAEAGYPPIRRGIV